jgi:hypothetical protein
VHGFSRASPCSTLEILPDILALIRMTREFTTHSAEETIALGRELASLLAPPKLVLLRGDLGGGKTTLVKGIAEGFQAGRRHQSDVYSGPRIPRPVGNALSH